MIDLATLKSKKAKLKEISDALKRDFVGIDSIIDNIMSSIETWYILPQLLTRPLIINLWGMTGVGKTDLVRKLVKYLDFSDKYLEIQLNSDTGGFGLSVRSELLDIGIVPDSKAILMLDEVQRFAALDEKGMNLRNGNYKDLWELLSDGSFSASSQELHRLRGLLYERLYWTQRGKGRSSNEELEYKMDPADADALRFKLQLDMPTKEIMKMSFADIVKVTEGKIAEANRKKETSKYNNLLIFICGNLDEAYKMAKEVSDVDTDADILHEMSKNISVLDIKNALQRKFKPEQIARFGNNHIIYPCLKKKDFEKLIEVKLSEIKERFEKTSKVAISYDPNLKSVIYKNGVFPTQGVRPLFSSLNSLVENVLPEFLLKAVENNVTELQLAADVSNGVMVGKFNVDGKEMTHTKPVQFIIDKLKKEIDSDKLALIAAHEIGHVIAYAVNFKTVPRQLCCEALNTGGGFIFPHNITKTKDSLLKRIQVALAGRVAEEMVFGSERISTGASRDLLQATNMACDMVREFAMTNQNLGIIHVPGSNNHAAMPLLSKNVDSTIEDILSMQMSNVRLLLTDNQDFFRELTSKLLEKRELDNSEIFEIAGKYVADLELVDLDTTINHNFNNMLVKFLSSEEE